MTQKSPLILSATIISLVLLYLRQNFNMSDDTQRKRANAPFGDDDSADLILSTSDNVLFRVHKFILSKASPVFADILPLPHAPPQGAQTDDYIDGLPVIRMEEDSVTMDDFLRCCYPEPMPKLALHVTICALYKAGKKYDTVAVTSHVEQALAQFALRTDCCLRTYAIACHLGIQPCAIQAARQSLNLSWNSIAHSRFDEMDLISATSLARLLSYHEKCADVVCNKIIEPSLLVFTAVSCMFEEEGTAKCCKEYPEIFEGVVGERIFVNGEWDLVAESAYYQAKEWAMNYLKELRAAIKRGDVPIKDAIGDPTIIQRTIDAASKCPKCRKCVVKDLTFKTEYIRKEIDPTTNKVSRNACYSKLPNSGWPLCFHRYRSSCRRQDRLHVLIYVLCRSELSQYRQTFRWQPYCDPFSVHMGIKRRLSS